MSRPELNDSIQQTFDTCALHLKRMAFARSRVDTFVPLDRNNYYLMDDETIGFLDQYIFRFSKLQDTMGSRLFPLLLDSLAEPVADLSFIDTLNRLERLGIIDSARRWIQLRKIRNDVTHEYPASIIERIEGINYLFTGMDELILIVERCRSVFDRHQ